MSRRQQAKAPLKPEVETLTLRNARGDSIELLSLGARLCEYNYASHSSGAINLILGYPHTRSYLNDSAYHGAIAGRYCNRIANSAFSLDGNEFTLDSNEGAHHLHGGSLGFHQRIWDIEEKHSGSATMRLQSGDGDQGYPGNLDVRVQYHLDDTGALDINWEATSDQDTIIGLTSHGYFNLSGQGDILDHYLKIPAEHFTPVDHDLIPTGEICSVENTVFDMRHFVRLGDRIASDADDIVEQGGFDHNWAFERTNGLGLRAQLLSPHTRFLLSLHSTLPGMQCYTGNHLPAGGIHGHHEGVCLEPQYYPNSPNQPNFPSPVLRAGAKISHHLRYEIEEVEADFLEKLI